MATDLAIRQPNGLVLRDDAAPGLALSFAAMRARVEALNEFYQGVMQKGTDYDVLPGTPKPTLLQPGAQLLDGIFGLAPTFEELGTSARDYERGFFAFDVRCRLVSKGTGETVAEGIGHCNSKEDKYRWRTSQRACPVCGEEQIIKGRKEYGGGWLCFAKKGGCGAKFKDGDPAIESQAVGRVENDDPYTLVNTILKMAEKRAHVAATLNATGASRIFTQDVEDLPEFQRRDQRHAPEVNAEDVARQEQPAARARPVRAAAPQPTPDVDAQDVARQEEEPQTDFEMPPYNELEFDALKSRAANLLDEIHAAVKGSTLRLPEGEDALVWKAWLDKWSGMWAAMPQNPKNAKAAV